jgi:hypothetical protein
MTTTFYNIAKPSDLLTSEHLDLGLLNCGGRRDEDERGGQRGGEGQG